MPMDTKARIEAVRNHFGGYGTVHKRNRDHLGTIAADIEAKDEMIAELKKVVELMADEITELAPSHLITTATEEIEHYTNQAQEILEAERKEKE